MECDEMTDGRTDRRTEMV